MLNENLFEWMGTCPSDDWVVIRIEEGIVEISFEVEEELPTDCCDGLGVHEMENDKNHQHLGKYSLVECEDCGRFKEGTIQDNAYDELICSIPCYDPEGNEYAIRPQGLIGDEMEWCVDKYLANGDAEGGIFFESFIELVKFMREVVKSRGAFDKFYNNPKSLDEFLKNGAI